MLRYTIITVCKNAENELEITLKSILSQEIDKSLFEVLIIDGLSEDNTVQIIENYQKKFQKLGIKFRYCSEKDKGIYDAMNKGAKLAEGQWCIYLNAGDKFFNNMSLKYINDEINNNYDVIYGDTLMIYNDKCKIDESVNEKSLNLKKGMQFCHQSSVIKTENLIKEPYKEEYKIASDFDFFVKLFINGKNFHYIPKTISIFDCNGVSITKGAEREKEHVKIKFKYGLIDENEYLKLLKKYNIRIKIKKILPKSIVDIIHKLTMKKITKKWNAFEELIEKKK